MKKDEGKPEETRIFKNGACMICKCGSHEAEYKRCLWASRWGTRYYCADSFPPPFLFLESVPSPSKIKYSSTFLTVKKDKP